MSFHQKIVRSCRNPHKGMRINTSARALQCSHRSCFTDKKPYEGVPYTERQKAIISGEIIATRKQEIVVIMKKAESLEQYDIAEKVYDMYGHMFHEVHEGDPSQKEADAILEALTPDDLK